MADPFPAEVFQYGIPTQNTPVQSEEVRDNFEALARNFYTEDPSFPVAPRKGQFRIYDSGTDVSLQWYDGTQWVDLQTGIGGGTGFAQRELYNIAAPATVWTIDHTIGERPIVQVYDATWNVLEPVPNTGLIDTIFLGTISQAILTTLGAGLTTLRADLPLSFRGTFIDAHAVLTEDITGSPSGSIEFELSGAGAMSGGNITLATGGFGTRLNGAAATAGATFESGDTLEVRANMTTAPTAGAIDLYARVRRNVQAGQVRITHVNPNRVTITHPAAITGNVILVG